MIIDTKFFGEIEAAEEDIIYFEQGLLGFEDEKKFIIINFDKDSPLKCLQSTEHKYAAFIVINPWDVFKDYDIDIDDDELLAFNDKDINNFAVYSIVTIREDKITANLIGPVLINVKTRRGKQIVLHKSRYTTKHIVKEIGKR